MSAPSPEWRVERVTLDVAEAHLADLTGPGASRLVRVHDIVRPTLVLGSAQPASHVDEAAVAAAGIDVVRRRSGGGAVLLTPGDVLWVDVVVPAGDPLWDDDVSRAFEWLGETWVRALAEVGVAGATVHRGAMACTAWCRYVCFAGVGAGEVTIDGHKVVGISQRRTRHAARFQCAALLRWDAVGTLRLLAVPDDERVAASRALAAVAAGLAVDGDRLANALISALP
ncbi:MAG TPA: hypothetical protein VF183_01255 [Acidimicrobiales bacterium]